MRNDEDVTNSNRALPDPSERPTITVEEAARILGVSRSYAYEAIKSGDIPVIRVRNRYVIPTARLATMLGLDGKTAA